MEVGFISVEGLLQCQYLLPCVRLVRCHKEGIFLIGLYLITSNSVVSTGDCCSSLDVFTKQSAKKSWDYSYPYNSGLL